MPASNPTCVYCGRRATCKDHIRPRSRGGTDEDSNLTPSCDECNSAKGAKLLTEWIPGRVLRAVAVEPKVYAELLRIRADDERQLAARHLARADAAALAREQALGEILSTRRAVGLTQAVFLGIVPIGLAAVRKARQRDPEFPEPIATGLGGELLYHVDELRAWAANRPSVLAQTTRLPGNTPVTVPAIGAARRPVEPLPPEPPRAG